MSYTGAPSSSSSASSDRARSRGISNQNDPINPAGGCSAANSTPPNSSGGQTQATVITHNGGQGARGSLVMDQAINKSVEVQRNVLDCPVCFESFRSKVWQCSEGHVLCESCKEQLPEPKRCPSCRKPLGDIRNRILEDLAKDAPLPCRNESRGCKVILPLQQRQAHEDECKYALFECPHPDFGAECKWMGEANKVVKHLEEAHCSVYTFKEVNSGDERDQWVTGRGPWISQNQVNGKSFLVYKYKRNNDFSVGVHHIGHGSPGKFRVRMELKGGCERIHMGPIQSLRVPPKNLSWFSVSTDQLDLDDESKIHFFITIEVN